MHQEKYTLTWHTYSDHLKSMMKDLMMNEDFSDVTLVTEDKKQIMANRGILSACSPVFKDILNKDKNLSSVVYLRGIQYSEMESIIQFIYLSKAQFYEKRMDEFLAVAKSLEIKELCNANTLANNEFKDGPLSSNPETSTDTYSDHLKSMMKNLMMNEDFSDVTLVTEDKKHIKANRGILSACSPVFKDILKKDRILSSVVYLRGIQYSELESIMQFIYLGKTTFYEKRRDEFLAVAKSLELEELCNAFTQANNEPKDGPLSSNSATSTDEQVFIFDDISVKFPRNNGDVSENRKYVCEPCHKIFSRTYYLNLHKQSVHEGIKYACDHCDYQASHQSRLTVHIQSKHEGNKYACDRCDQQFAQKKSLVRHIQSMHEGVKYDCNQCDYKATQQGNLKMHILSKHEGIRYPCDQCEYQAKMKGDLVKHTKLHMKTEHRFKRKKN